MFSDLARSLLEEWQVPTSAAAVIQARLQGFPVSLDEMASASARAQVAPFMNCYYVSLL